MALRQLGLTQLDRLVIERQTAVADISQLLLDAGVLPELFDLLGKDGLAVLALGRRQLLELLLHLLLGLV